MFGGWSWRKGSHVSRIRPQGAESKILEGFVIARRSEATTWQSREHCVEYGVLASPLAGVRLFAPRNDKFNMLK